MATDGQAGAPPGGEEGASMAMGPPAEVEQLRAYFLRIVPVLLEEDVLPDTSILEGLLKSAEARLKKFIEDPQEKAVFIVRSLPPEEEGDAAGSTFSPTYEVRLGLNYRPTRSIGVAFLKRAAVLEADKSIRAQLRVINFTEDSPFETLHSYIRDAVTPYFTSFVQASKKAGEGDKLVPSVQKKMNELEVGLLHLQQNIDIPEISLPIHPAIMAMVRKAEEAKRRPSVEDLGASVTDSTFLNALQKDVSRWIREIQKVTRLERDASSGTALQETSFWLNLENALNKIHQKRHSPEVTLTLDVLKAGKRFHATVSFDSDTGLKEAQDKVLDYNPLMKDFPVNELLAASSLESIQAAVAAIYNHLRKIRSTTYPAQRSIYLVESISRDLSTQLLKVLGTHKLMLVTYEEFEQIMTRCQGVFTTWDDEYDKFAGMLREMSKKKREETLKFSWRANPAHKKLQDRAVKMRQFRKHHEQLQAVIVRVLRPTSSQSQPASASGGTGDQPGTALETDDLSAVREVKLAYENVKVVDCLDLSPEGSAAWEAARKRYDERIDRVETRIAARLRDQLGTARNANEMFRIFSRYNALFVRAHIRGAIREYQTQLIQRVKDDIEGLHNKFKMQYSKTTTYRMCTKLDFPPVSSAIIWARQIDRQLQTYLQRVEAVLGKGWENHVEGQKLKQDGDSFRQKLNTQQLFEDWKKKVETRQHVVQGRIFNIVSQRTRTGTLLRLQVNFSPETITLAKEVRNMKWLGFRVPFAIVNLANQANQLYPHAVSLMESIRTYELTCQKIDDHKGISPLVAALKCDVQEHIKEGCLLTWESYKLESFVQKFSDTIFYFQERVDDVLSYTEQIETLVCSLETCEYNSGVFRQVLDQMQKLIDDLNLRSYSNLHQWVTNLDKQVEIKLIGRLSLAICSWTDCLLGAASDQYGVDTSMDTTPTSKHPPLQLGGTPELEVIHHELHITNQIMHLQPPVEMARCRLIGQLHEWISTVAGLPRIQSSRYQVGLVEVSPVDATYRSILGQLMRRDATPLTNAYDSIEKLLQEVNTYVQVWLQYQSLWDMESGNIYSRLDINLGRWQKLLLDIKKSRKTIDNTETMKKFGPVEIHYGKVQSKVNLKYDSWHREIVSKFGGLLGQNMQEFHTTIAKCRSDLENHSVDAASTSEAVGFITLMQELKRKLRGWESQVENFRAGEKILDRQRFQFPPTWVYVDNVEGEWGAFNEIMKRKDSAVSTQIGSLQMKIVAEDKVVEQKTQELLQDWEKGKPVKGDLRPDDAANLLTIFEGKFTRLKEDRDNVIKAKEALELADPGLVTSSDERVTVVLEELQDLKGVWSELSKVWEKIEELREKPWLSVAPRKIRQALDALLQQLRAFPSRLKSYASFEYVQGMLKGYTKVNMLVTELKSEALKERHWKQLMKKLRVSWQLHDLSLGQVWAVDLQRNELIVKDIILVAQGEMALEEFLKQVREAWQNYELDLINYQNKCRLIRGWDDLFNKLKEHINSVAAMKLSPYFKVFEDDAIAWEERLNRINAIFDVWIDVQRRWVYLEGIFTGSADIKHLLPNETQRFQSISSEFLALMKKVAKSPLVMDIVNIPGVQKSLERLADLLGKIQKALGEYLERERASFPRFYFVGDEDLLEIIGNSKSVPKLQKHFKKMFAGVASVILSEDGNEVLGICSREGEQVMFKTPVSILDNPKINQWLSLVEKEMRLNLATLLAQAVEGITQFNSESIQPGQYMQWVDRYQAQLVVLAAQIAWSNGVDSALQSLAAQSPPHDFAPLQRELRVVEATLNVLADSVLQEQPPVRRKKLEHLITELVHQRDTTRMLLANKVASPRGFEWLSQMRFYFDPKRTDVLQQLSIHMANARFNYGFEYLGVQDKLVQTPLTDRCYLTMTQALEERLGGSPFGPAGTGKTESVKALGHQMGRFVLVFNCDERFDFQAMGRIFVGLCQVGAWGCFDEFNRLEERMLSAVSQQIQTIQETLKERGQQTDLTTTSKPIVVELVGKTVKVNPDMAIFITMNPGYAGRSNLPDNLKQLFRSLAMTKPDRQLIAQVMLYSQGFRMAEKLASKIVPFFKLCDEQLSSQPHYDFGLRALKSVLVSAGNVKRDRILQLKEELTEQGKPVNEGTISEKLHEQEILIQSVCETMVPKLVSDDIPLLHSLLSDVFPGVRYTRAEMGALRKEIARVCSEMHLVAGETGQQWVEKVLQLYQITQLHHGLMMVGPSGSGKSTAWRVLLRALERLEGVEGVAHIIDPKAISKEDLYGVLDPNTREWTDGLFTSILRRIIDNVRGELNKRQWIIFDGDVDPEWVENQNSVLDDNKLLTLPNGERLSLPPNVRIMFEVQDLRYATLATVSRCGMVWFSESVLSLDIIFEHFLNKLRDIPIDEGEDETRSWKASAPPKSPTVKKDEILSPTLQVQHDCADLLVPHFSPDGLVVRALQHAETLDHIMDFTRLRALGSLFSMLNQMVRNVLNYNQMHPDFPMPFEQLEQYVPRYLVYSILWSFSGDGKMKSREQMGEFVRSVTTIPLPATSVPIIDFEVTIQGEWSQWANRVPKIEVETHKVGSPDVVVPTLDTVRHESLLYTWLAEHKPMVLCGPPGSGKTMTLFSALRALPDFEVVGLNFSSATSPELLLKTFDHYCEYRRTPNGVVMSPVQLGKWVVLFCDEINLPDFDKYGTQRVISFLRQIVEHGGFYRTSDQTWITLERIQFVGACNPPTDPGRKPLSHRFLRHVPVIYVDYPGATSLTQIYGTFNRAMLRLVPNLRTYADPLTNAMVDFYTQSQNRFTQDMQPHYIYSPREMTRWVRGIYEALKPHETLPVEALVRVWTHEGLRLFQDRLVYDEERMWTDENIDAVAMKHFPNVEKQASLARPILYSNWLSKDYVPVHQEELREYVQARLKVFYEEELDVPLVLFNEVLDHVLRIDRIFKQSQGHLLLIGVSGAGKTTLSRFVAWINGLSVFQIKVHRKYTADDFDDDLRMVLRRSGCRDEKMVFILDESNIMESSFLERMNTLLANGEVPGLFEGDEFTTLMTQCKEGSQRDGLMLDSAEELYKWFTQKVMRNLHVVFTMNPSSQGLKDRAATSPALFNRCVLNWFGDWSNGALYQVGYEFTNKVDLDRSDYVPDFVPPVYADLPQPPTHRQAIINAFVYVHQTLHQANTRLAKKGASTMAITPRHYLDFINHYVKLYNEKRSDLEEQQLHLNVGLQKIRETVDQVEELQASLSIKKNELEQKNSLANQKLKQMVKDQQEAEKKKITSQEIQESLQRQTKEISEKKSVVLGDLAKVEPAVRDAQQAVKSIKKQHLVEVRSLPNPPETVKMAMESVCIMIGEPATDWRSIRSILLRDNFIPTIIKFSTEDITPDARDRLKRDYLSKENYNFEAVNRASKACGPLVKWAIAQLSYADVLNRVDPLRRELKMLEHQAETSRMKGEEINKIIRELEQSIAKYKEEYAVLISEANMIKADLKSVEDKVERSKNLLTSLAGEKERWEAGSETFKSQMSTITGDVLLTSAFMAYGGYFDQQFRATLFASWASHLQQANIHFRADLARVEYLSNADERLRWQANALPADDLCTENAIMIQRFNRYPLVIDPSGQATEFILNEYKDRKITKTSFLDDAFRKNLESALRFGNPLLVQDVESYDPILNPVLNREVRRTGGRVLITLGDQDIDLSPAFTIFLSTRDPSVEFPPDLCSRVTFVNFTVTRGSLQSQCLNQVLKAERPDVDAKRSDLLKLQGEFHLRLRHLEQSLLQALNEVKGRILDDDRIVTQLENLKREAAEVQRKVEETDVVMAEVERVSQQYLPLSTACSSIYFTLEGLNQVHFLYQYSLQFFLDIFQVVLSNNPNLRGVVDHGRRLEIITSNLFQSVYNRVARGMLHDDRVVLAILLCRIHLKGVPSEPDHDAEFEYFLRGKESLRMDIKVPETTGLNKEQNVCMHHISKQLPSFSSLSYYISGNTDFLSWLQSVAPQQSVPECWETEKPLSHVGKALYNMLVIQTFRADHLLASASLFVATVMGESYMQQAEQELDLATIVTQEVKASTPVLLCSVTGYDASGRVDDLATQQGKQCTSIAIGSAEGFSLAEKAIFSAAKTGRWVLLKNVHLAPQWLVQLEKKLHSLTPHSSFRLFLTLEINPKVPVNLLRASRVFTFEPPPGVKANLIRTFSTVPAARMCKEPHERARLYFLLAWLHAIIQERLRYAPLGWAKKYEFNESDLRMACDTLDTWLESVAQGRTNLPPSKVPWSAFRTLLSQCIYGGRIDNDFDQRLLNSFVNRLFTEKSFESDFPLMSSIDGTEGKNINMPDGIRREQFLQWVEHLPDNQTPSWLGLPNNAEKVLLTNKGAAMIAKLLKMQTLGDDDEFISSVSTTIMSPTRKDIAGRDGRPAWMRTLHSTAVDWLLMVPEKLNVLKRTAENIKDPLFRFFEREVNTGARLLRDVRHDLEDVVEVCEARKKQTNYLRSLTSDLAKGIIPRSWRRYTVPSGLTVIQWVSNFSERIKQLQHISQQAASQGTKALKTVHIWLGGLFTPEAYITATRQYVAQANNWSLEELYLDVQVDIKGQLDDCSFGVTGLKLQGAQCVHNTLALASTILNDLPLTALKWTRVDPSQMQKLAEGKVTLPVYLNSTRAELLFTLDFKAKGMSESGDHHYYERGVALLSSGL